MVLRRLPLLLPLSLVITRLPAIANPDAERAGADAPLAMISDDELRQRLISSGGHDEGEQSARDRVLSEIARRGGEAWEQFLTRTIEEELATRKKEVDQGRRLLHAAAGAAPDFQLLTALRRAQKQADPVVIAIRPDKVGPVACTFPARPTIPVALVNQDGGKRAIRLKSGGDYRTGRQERWRFDVRDHRGRSMPVKREFPGAMGGGLYNHVAFGFGERWETYLDMGSFVPALPPGSYTVTILYHNELLISRMADVSGLVVARSPPIALTMAPAEVELSEARVKEIRELLGKIGTKGPLRIVAGTYGEWAHDLVAPKSAQGRLLSVGLAAVPPLLAALDDPNLSSERRALVLSLLFSLTGEHNPHGRNGRSRLVPCRVRAVGGARR